jgi:twitching motility protein PilT
VALVNSLLTAIVRADGDALVMHVGEKPYVVASAGQIELSSRALTLEAVSGMLEQLLPEDARRSLDEIGAIEHELEVVPAEGSDRFTVVAARGGDDVWIEVRRHRRPAVEAEPEPAPEPVVEPEPVAADDGDVIVETIAEEEPVAAPAVMPSEPVESEAELSFEGEELDLPTAATPPPVELPCAPAPVQRATPGRTRVLTPPRIDADIPEPQPAVVLPLSRNPVRGEQPRVNVPSRSPGLDRLFRLAAARGASALYLVSNARPSIRVDGEISVLDREGPLSASEVESLILDLMPERNREALRSGVGTEWICDVPDVGRVRCVSFRDHRGAGGIFRMIPARAISAEQLGLSREIQGLCAEPEGLVLVTGPRSSGKSTLISAFVDLINRTRGDHVITLESQIKFVHDSRASLISQREVRGDNDEWFAVARAALRENPDVLVIEDLRTPALVTLALEAAGSGHLVIGALPAHTTTAAVDRIIDQAGPDRRAQVQLALADALRALVAQALLRKTGGGRVAAREVLLNTPSVASLISEGKTSQLPLALDNGRKYGMVPLNDALVAFVQSGAIDAREAYRKASDRQGFITLLKREGIDTSFVERLALAEGTRS